MVFLLSTQNVSRYLVECGVYPSREASPDEIKLRACKNFNLSVSFPEGQHFLVKQECRNSKGETNGEINNEWYIHLFLEAFPELALFRPLLPEIRHFDPDSAIVVSHYFSDYCDLEDFYEETGGYSLTIARSLAQAIATIHRETYNVEAYKEFLRQTCGDSVMRIPRFRRLERIKPEIFGLLCEDGIDFLRLYQRYDSLHQAIALLQQTWQPCCLIHNDLKLNNILLRQTADHSSIRLIDWEKFIWGDPAFDVATILASYLKIWLGSLMMSTDLDVETSLRLAGTPLEQLQPTLTTFMRVYLQSFPAMGDRDPSFIQRIGQMTGLCLIQRIQTKLEYREPFGNGGICMLQVAKSLLCQPETSIPEVFGISTLDQLF